ncbi:unnamed protein product [Caenorhabditis sp. 36 PRJEB53466]|nr:unnamed protein product [Caenorhabditis sp. 36 PRJEB53466]
MRCPLLIIAIICSIATVSSASSFLNTLCLKCNASVEMFLPADVDTFYAMSDLFIKDGVCAKFGESFADTCYTLINVPLRVQYNVVWTFVSPFRELICMPFCVFAN